LNHRGTEEEPKTEKPRKYRVKKQKDRRENGGNPSPNMQSATNISTEVFSVSVSLLFSLFFLGFLCLFFLCASVVQS
jgi:hypothetical protein